MPKKKEHPPASRRSYRLINEPIEQLEQLNDEESPAGSSFGTDQTLELEAQSNDLDLAVPSIEVREEDSDEFESTDEDGQPTPAPEPTRSATPNMANFQNPAEVIAQQIFLHPNELGA